MRATLPPILALLCGCGAPEPYEMGHGPVPLAPPSGVVEGWVVETGHVEDLACPDGQTARLLVARPDPAPAQGQVAVVYHPGAFDWVQTTGDNPLVGQHFASESRLDGAWAIREAASVLGHWPSADPLIESQGALAVALAEAGVTLVLPANCWGDLWHNEVGEADTGRENDTFRDGFDRNGFAMARAGWDIATSGAAAEAAGVTVPRGEVWLIGLGTGGRAVSELLHDGEQPDAVGFDSTPDDLRAYLEGDPVLYADVVTGLGRLFPDGTDAVDDGALWTAPLPGSVTYWWSSRDPAVPAAAHEAALERLATTDARVHDAGVTLHVATSGDLAAARAFVADLAGNAGGARHARVDAHPIGQ